MELSVLTRERMLVRKQFDLIDMKDVNIATALKPNKDFIELLRIKNLLHKIIDFNGTPCVIFYSEDLYFYPELRLANSPKSNARYYARSKNKMDGLLLQYLPPHSNTSKHYHEEKIEIYHNLEGICLIESGHNKILLERCSYKVGKKIIHQVTTDETSSLTVLEIIGDPNGLSMDDHHYVE